MNIGYIRVSSCDQNTARQITAFEDLRLDKVFEDRASGKDVKRPALERCLEMLREGDILHVHSIDRLARSLRDLLGILSDLTGRGIVVTFHKEGLRPMRKTPFNAFSFNLSAR